MSLVIGSLLFSLAAGTPLLLKGNDTVTGNCRVCQFTRESGFARKPNSEHDFRNIKRNGSSILSTVTARITHNPDSIILNCKGGEGYKGFSWWFYGCPKENNVVEKTELSQHTIMKFRQFYQLQTARTSRMVSSSLKIKNLKTSEIAGLYRCNALPSIQEKRFDDNDSSVHYFIVGYRKALKSCFPLQNKTKDPGVLLKTIRKLIARDIGDFIATYEFLLKIPKDMGSTHDYKIRFSLPDVETRNITTFDFMNFELSNSFQSPFNASRPLKQFTQETEDTGRL